MSHANATIHAPTVAAVAAVVVVVVGGLYWAGECGRDTSTVVADASGMVEEETTQPLPEEVLTLKQAVRLATQRARAWRADARMTRVYATEVARDGRIDRQASVVQCVFVSPGATQAGPPVLNGFRWMTSKGAVTVSEIMQQPAPPLTVGEAELCDVAALLGADAPERVTVDVQLAAVAPAAPAWQAFADQPEKWLLVADPYQCEVRMRSSRRTAQESESALPGPAASAEPFDGRAAGKAVDGALARAGCPTADAGIVATVTIQFALDGTVRAVEVTPERMQAESSFVCIADRLRKVRVRPWHGGDGHVVRRIPL
jgi:hypothetical protein